MTLVKLTPGEYLYISCLSFKKNMEKWAVDQGEVFPF